MSNEFTGLLSYPSHILGNNLLLNSDFSQGMTYWTATSSVFSIENNRLKMKDANLYQYTPGASQTLSLSRGSYLIGGNVEGVNIEVSSSKGVRFSAQGYGSSVIVNGTFPERDLNRGHIWVDANNPTAKFAIDCYNKPSGIAYFDNLYVRREVFPLKVFCEYPNFKGLIFGSGKTIRLFLELDPLYVGQNLLVQIMPEGSSKVIESCCIKTNTTEYSRVFSTNKLQYNQNYIIRARLILSGGLPSYEHPGFRVRKIYAEDQNEMTVSYNDKNQICFYGTPTFIRGVYDSGMGYCLGVPTWETMLTNDRKLFEYKINVYNNYWYGQATLQSMTDLMTCLQNHGIYYLQTANCFSTDYPDNYFAIDTNPSFLSGIAPHPQYMGIYHVDECTTPLVEEMHGRYAVVANAKQGSVTFGALLDPGNLHYWVQSITLTSTDPYPISGAGPSFPLERVADWSAINKTKVRSSRPFLTVLQFFKQTSNSRWPTRDELWNMACMAIAAGAEGVLFWSIGIRALASVPPTGTWSAERLDYHGRLKSVLQELYDNDEYLTMVDTPEYLVSNSNSNVWVRVKGYDALIVSNHANTAQSTTVVLNSEGFTKVINLGAYEGRIIPW
jgi:hypothetical protein